MRLSTTVVDELETDVSSGFGSFTGDIEYESHQLAFGSYTMAGEVKSSSWEFGFAKAEYATADALEIEGGGRFFFGATRSVAPYIGIGVVATVFDEDDVGDDVDGQTGFRPSIGTELNIAESAFIDLNAGYLVPIIPAEDNLGNELEIEGLTVRVGIGFSF